LSTAHPDVFPNKWVKVFTLALCKYIFLCFAAAFDSSLENQMNGQCQLFTVKD